MKNKADYSLYRCPYDHIEKECGHELMGPEGYEDTHGVWCACGYRGPVFILEPEKLGLKAKASIPGDELEPMSVTERVDYLSELFTKETGCIPPCKDTYICTSASDRDEAQRRWADWLDVFYGRIVMQHKLITQPEQGGHG